MSLFVANSGTQTATINTEHTLATITTPGSYVLNVDTTNLANGDVLELRVYIVTLNAGASVVAYFATYANVQGEPSKFSIPVPVSQQVIFTLKQTAGTGRGFPWAALQLDH